MRIRAPLRLALPKDGGNDRNYIAGAIAEGSPLEEVRFMRDEMANVAWAVEGIVEGPIGAIDRTEREQVGRDFPVKKASREASGDDRFPNIT
jgi:hypothetical protein